MCPSTSDCPRPQPELDKQSAGVPWCAVNDSLPIDLCDCAIGEAQPLPNVLPWQMDAIAREQTNGLSMQRISAGAATRYGKGCCSCIEILLKG